MTTQLVISQGPDLRDLEGSSEVSSLALELLPAQVGTGSAGFVPPLLVPPLLMVRVSQHFIHSVAVA